MKSKSAALRPNLRKQLLCCLAFLISHFAFLICPIHAKEVESEGRAAGDQSTAREQALADALREAVRVGVGVDVASSSKVTDFALDYDRILSAAFGHVKTYSIVSSGLGKDGIYKVKVKADVQPGTPGAKDTLALRQIVLLKGSPRVSIKVEDQIDGAAGPTSYAQGIMEQTGRELQLNLVDIGTARAQESKMASRDEILGNDKTAKLRKADISQKADFLIEGKVVARYVGQQSSYGSLPQHVFSVGGELRAIRPETGEIVATAALPGTERVESDLESKEMAARDVIQKVLAGTGKTSNIFNKILARWVTETDLGAIKRLEFTGMSSEAWQKLQAAMKDTDKISAVWPREFDAQGISNLDIETRLDNPSIEAVVTKATESHYATDRATDNLIAFKPGTPAKKSWWPW